MPLLLASFIETWPYLHPFVSALLAAITAFLLATLTQRRTEAAKVGAETAAEKKAWREGLIAADRNNADAIAAESRARLLSQLENAADWERVVGILKDFGEVQKLLAVVASTSQHHSTEIATLNRRLDETAKHLNEFIMRHVNRPA